MGDIWEAEAKRLEPTQGMWSHFAAFQAWLNRCNQGLSEFNTEKLNGLEQVDLYTLFLAVANDRIWGANVPTFPEVQTDAERLAMAVLKGDTSAALALADLVSEEWAAKVESVSQYVLDKNIELYRRLAQSDETAEGKSCRSSGNRSETGQNAEASR